MVLCPAVHLWLPGCTTLPFRPGLYLPFGQARDGNLQVALISTWLSEGPISTCTSSGWCRPAVLIRGLQETRLCQQTSAGGEHLRWLLAAVSCLCWCDRGNDEVRGLRSGRKIHCAASPMLANQAKGKARLQFKWWFLTEEHFRQPCWLASAHKQEWVPVCAIVSKKRPSAYSNCNAE